MKSKIPDRWANYVPYGCVIKGTRFLACKVPLKTAVMRRLPIEYEFTPETLMSEMPNIKGIVDLTGTSRYYDADEFTSNGVEHRKIEVPGQRVPRPFKIRRFFAVIDELLAILKNDEIIAVHCTHGLNRTGYLICRYLVEKMGWSLPVAIAEFQKARGHEIERIAYIKDLERMVTRETHSANLDMLADYTSIMAPPKYQPPVCHYYNTHATHHIRFEPLRPHQPLRFPINESIPNERHIRFDSPPRPSCNSKKVENNPMAHGSVECRPETMVPMPRFHVDSNPNRHVRSNSPQRKSLRDINNGPKKIKSRTTIITNWRDHTPPPDVTPQVQLSAPQDPELPEQMQKLDIKQDDEEKSKGKKRKRRRQRLKSQGNSETK